MLIRLQVFNKECCNQNIIFQLNFVLFLEVLRLLLHSFPYQRRPGDAFLSGAGVDLVHLRQAGGACTDEEHGLVLMRHFPNYQPLKGDHRWFVILHEQR